MTAHTRGVWHDRARQLAAMGKPIRAIADETGVTYAAVWKVLNPDRSREHHRRDNARPGRAEEKAQAAKKSARKPEYRGRCTMCSGLMGIGVREDGVCRQCVQERRRARALSVQQMWAAGHTYGEISEALGLSVGHLAVEINWARANGFDIPHRRSPEQRERTHAARWGTAA